MRWRSRRRSNARWRYPPPARACPLTPGAALLLSSCAPCSHHRQLEHVVAPRRQVEIETARNDIGSVAIVGGRSHQILKLDRAAMKVRKRKTDVALTLVRGIVDRDEQALAVVVLPAPSDEAVARPVSVPRGAALEQAPLSILDARPPEHGQQTVVELRDARVDGLERRADEVRRDAFATPLELALMEEPQAGRQVRDDRRGLVHPRRKRRRGPGLVVILHEPREPALIVESGPQMLTHRPRVSVAQPVVEPLVIGVVEAFLDHRPLEVPVHLGHEAESRRVLSHSLDRPRPERHRPVLPRALEDVRQYEHRHVAADAVTLTGDLQQLADHRLLRGRIRVVELQRVWPAIEIWIAP